MHNQIRQIAAVLVAALLALTVLHCMPAAAATTATDRSQPTMMVSRADQEVAPAAAKADSVMHCAVIGSVLAAGSNESRLSWPAIGPSCVVMQRRYMFDNAGVRAPPHLLAQQPGAASGRLLLHQLCVNRR
ncbi:hypothetical protein [Mycobacterium sp. D16R24]|uniref:hypothetical protein n=1 Tax=Mycobacterium sp. D16R24 TaxID=1855656 RepID=UPI0025706645|nr:hypothetical protein [Mycobacterium sp. D16R24]